MEWTNNVKNKIDERITHLPNNVYTKKHTNCQASPDAKYALHNLKDLMPLFSVIAKELGLNNYSSTGTCNKINNLSANNTIKKNIKDRKIKFDVGNIFTENQMHKNPVKTRFK